MLTPIKFQLQWFPQSQFAGYYAAIDQGYYRDLGLDVTMLLGGPNVNGVRRGGRRGHRDRLAPEHAAPREGGADLVSIAQIFQRSPTRMASFKATNITKPASMAGKKIGSWRAATSPSCSRR